MIKLRFIAGLLLAFALANYGVVASASAHAHDSDEFHPIHLIDGHESASDHHDSDETLAADEVAESLALEINSPAPPDHKETGFHSHSTLQFGPVDGMEQLAFAMIKSLPHPSDPDGFRPLLRDRPPFKPPRVTL